MRTVAETAGTSAGDIVKALELLEKVAVQRKDALRIALSGAYTNLGKMLIELWTVNETGCDDIAIYVWFDNAWAEVGRVPLWRIVSERSRRGTIRVSGLMPNGADYFKIVSEPARRPGLGWTTPLKEACLERQQYERVQANEER
jgi:hypothetical protein